MPRIRDIGFNDWTLPAGLHNSITDVPGVAVGHYTLIEGEGEWQPGQGPFRTGVTLVLPHTGNLYAQKVVAAVHTINGFGKVVGFEQVRELGQVETPIALTGTLNVPRVADALITLAIEANPHIGVGFAESGRQGYASVNAVVGETSDGFLSDLQGRPIGEAEVRAALAAATAGPVAEGAVGAGAGTSCYGWKGGIGTASRVVTGVGAVREPPLQRGGGEPPLQGGEGDPPVLGVLVQSNFGSPPQLVIAGVPIGRHLQPPPPPPAKTEGESIMIVLATNAPLDSRQLGRLCRRAAFGLARTGSTCHASSGDFVIAFTTAYRVADRPETVVEERPALHEQSVINPFFTAVIECVEEAIYNSLLMAQTVVGRDGNTRHGLPAEQVAALLRRYERIR